MEIQKSMLEANQVFIICASEDKDYVLAVQKNLESRKLKVWSMFKSNGDFAVAMGKDHLQEAINQLEKSCLVLLIISKNSIEKGTENCKDPYIFNELRNFTEFSSRCKAFQMRLLSICIEKDYFAELPVDWTPFGISKYKITHTLTKNTSVSIDDIVLNRICNEVSSIYYDCMSSNYKYILDNKYALVVLGNKLMQANDTSVRTVSDDIRQADENNSATLNSIHLITDEITEYDMNAYALMIISANLLGQAEGGKYYPKKNGVKYYYYCPQKYLAYNKSEESFKEQIKLFLKRDEKAIYLAENSIRAHYVVSNNLISYLKEMFYKKSVSSFFSDFSISESEKEQFIAEIDEDYKYYDYYDSDSEMITLPDAFLDWMCGKLSNIKSGGEDEAILFIHKVTELIKHTKFHNEPKLDRLLEVDKMLEKIYKFHSYMQGKSDNITPRELRSIVKKVINLSSDRRNELINQWVVDRNNSNEWEIQNVDDVISEAMNNIKFIPIKESEDFVICNSFAVYEHKNKVTGKRNTKLVWYSTAHNLVQTDERVTANDEEEKLAITNEKTTDQDCDVVRNTLKYLKETNLIDSYREF